MHKTAYMAAAAFMLAACAGEGDGRSSADQQASDMKSELTQLVSDPMKVERGQKLFSNCAMCHAADAAKVSPAGPNLAGIVGREIGSLESYPFTQALTNAEGVWTVAKLNIFLENPQQAYPGTAMAYAGIASAEDREALIAYLASVTLSTANP